MTGWEKFMPTECPWCKSKDRPKQYAAGMCNNSWHKSHPQHRLMWPMWRIRTKEKS